MTDKERIEEIIRKLAASFSGEQSVRDWTEETIWFDAAPFACVGADRARVRCKAACISWKQNLC